MKPTGRSRGSARKPSGEKYVTKSLKFPPALWEELTALVPEGDRSALIQQAVERELRRLRRQREKAAAVGNGAAAAENAAPANSGAASADRPIWEVIEELTRQVPEEDLATLPTDLAEQHDHYLYGSPKR